MRNLLLSLVTLSLLATPLVAQQAPERHKIAVLDFGYATVMSDSQAVFGSNVDIGKGISDMLIDKLLSNGTYRVIERNAINKVVSEQNFSNSNRADAATAAKIGHILGVDASLPETSPSSAVTIRAITMPGPLSARERMARSAVSEGIRRRLSSPSPRASST